jgi:hypothetical protein
MKKCSAFILLACVFGLLTTERVAAAPVTWDFVATSCTAVIPNPPFGCVATQHYPALVATLTLAGPDSSGSAFWGEFRALSMNPFCIAPPSDDLPKDCPYCGEEQT